MPSNNNSGTLFFFAILLIGAIVFIIGTMLRREREAQRQPVVEAAPVAHPELDVETRLDLVERLAMVGQQWCVQQLNTIRDTDPDASVREAADAALLVIGARGVQP